MFGDKLVGSIDAFEIQDFVASIRVRKGKRDGSASKPASGKTVKNLVSTLSMMHSSAVAWNLTDRDWLTGVVLPEWIKAEARHFTLEEANRILNSAEEPFKTSSGSLPKPESGSAKLAHCTHLTFA